VNFIHCKARSTCCALALPLLNGLLGCDDPLKNPQELHEPRVLGVRVRTLGDQASLEPGQDATFDLLLADSAGPVQAQVAFTLCAAASSVRGVPYCEGTAFAQDSVDLAQGPIVAQLPDSLPSDANLALLGVACLAGEPQLGEAPLDWSCAGREQPLRFSFEAWPSSAEFTNQNPDLTQLRVQIGGTELPLDELQATPSCGAEAPGVAAGETHAVEIVLGEAAREPGNDSANEPDEALQLSHFSTLGLFERQYSFVTAEQRPGVTLEWQAPAVGEAVKQYLVVRDGRGGVTWVSWSICAR
jgi:hypothetical protein